ncbi:hypothetical protein Tco_1543554 [Tanacetum coccineum]
MAFLKVFTPTSLKIPPFGIEKETLEFSKAVAEYQNSARYSLYMSRDLRRATLLFVLRMMSSRLKLTYLATTVVLVMEEFVLGLPFE